MFQLDPDLVEAMRPLFEAVNKPKTKKCKSLKHFTRSDICSLMHRFYKRKGQGYSRSISMRLAWTAVRAAEVSIDTNGIKKQDALLQAFHSCLEQQGRANNNAKIKFQYGKGRKIYDCL